MKFYVLENQDLTNLGGPMGTEQVATRWLRYFRTASAAKKAAEKDFKKTIKWKKAGKDKFTSGDLLHTMYHIR